MKKKDYHATCWDQDEEFYMQMMGRHINMWTFLHRFITIMQCRSVIEIGGGTGWVSQNSTIQEYTCIDRNVVAINEGRRLYPKAYYIHGNIFDITDPMFAHLVLAAGVVEHCEHWQPFIERLLEIAARFIIITFFRGLTGTKVFEKVTAVDGGCFYENRYRYDELEPWLKQMQLQHTFFTTRTKDSRDIVLILHKEPLPKFNISFVMEGVLI